MIDDPKNSPINDRQAAAPPVPPQEGVDYYMENGWCVFTKEYHVRRGYCCRSGCRHCPYGYALSSADKSNGSAN
jgi:hypothetical protein